MGLVVSDSGGQFTPAPEGTHAAICVQMVDLGHQYSRFYDKWRHRIRLTFELTNEDDGSGKHPLVSTEMTASLAERAQLRATLEAWRGRKFTKEELKGFQLKNILGKPCMVTVVHNEQNGRTYANIQAITQLAKGMPAGEAQSEILCFDMDDDPACWDVFERLPEFLREKILQSQEQAPSDDSPPAAAPKVQPARAPSNTTEAARQAFTKGELAEAKRLYYPKEAAADAEFDDEIPFLGGEPDEHQEPAF